MARDYKYIITAYLDPELTNAEEFSYAMTEDEAYQIALEYDMAGYWVTIWPKNGVEKEVDFKTRPKKLRYKPLHTPDEEDDFGYPMDEAMSASLLNVKNQLMKILSNTFKFTGGSMIDKFTMTSTEEPDVSFEVSMDRNDVSVLPKYNGQPDTMHKKRGIAIMRAANVIKDFVTSIVDNYKPAYAESVKRLRIKESVDGVRINQKLRKQLNKIAAKYSRWLYPHEIRGFYDEISELGITIPMWNKCDDNNAHEYLLDGQPVINSMVVFTKYEGTADSEKDEYNIYFS